MADKQYSNELSGAIFRSKNKRGPKSPDRTGQCQILGIEFWVSGWIKKDRNGNDYMSMAFTPKEDKDEAQYRHFNALIGTDEGTASDDDFDDDDVPF
jgi:hypothetical protein